MHKKTTILFILISVTVIQSHLRAQVPNVVEEVVRAKIGEHFDDRWMNMAAKKAKEINQAASVVTDKADAEKVIKEYQSDEVFFVEKSWKYNDPKPRDYFRDRTSKTLENLNIKFGVFPKRNFIERFVIWIDGITS